MVGGGVCYFEFACIGVLVSASPTNQFSICETSSLIFREGWWVVCVCVVASIPFWETSAWRDFWQWWSEVIDNGLTMANLIEQLTIGVQDYTTITKVG